MRCQLSQRVRDPDHSIPGRLGDTLTRSGGGAIESYGDFALTAQLDNSAKARDLPQPSAALAAGLAKLIKPGARAQIAVMRAEAVPGRCHRSLSADALLVRGLRVEHITTATRRQEHKLRRFARAEGTRIPYPPEATLFGASN